MNKTLIFIHGIGLGDWLFRENFSSYYVSRGYDVHVLNLPGHSECSKEIERQRITLDTCVRFVEEYLAHNVFSPHVIVGMSMGGGVCQRLLAKHGFLESLCGMVFLSSVPPKNNLQFTLHLCKRLARSNPEVLVDFFSGKVNPALIFSPESLLHFHEGKIKGYAQRVLKGFDFLEYEVFFQDLITNPFTVDLPLKIIGGRDDLLFPPEVTEFTGSYYSRKVDILPGLGHMIPIESNYMHGIRAIDSFLEEVF